MFHTADSTLAGQNIDVTKQQFTSQIMIRAPLTLEGRPSVFEARQNTLVFGKKPLQPYLDGEVKAEQLSKPLPDIYPLNRTISLHGKNIYRMEHKFREFVATISLLMHQTLILDCAIFDSRPARGSVRSTHNGGVLHQQTFH